MSIFYYQIWALWTDDGVELFDIQFRYDEFWDFEGREWVADLRLVDELVWGTGRESNDGSSTFLVLVFVSIHFQRHQNRTAQLLKRWDVIKVPLDYVKLA